MPYRNTLSSARLAGAAIAVLAVAPVSNAHAQSRHAGDGRTAAGHAATGRAPADIIVTGSRIPASGGDAPMVEPAMVADAPTLSGRNHTNVADALNELPGFRGSVTPAGAQASFGQGANFINAFGLGSNRTLTLLDGRRIVSSNVPSVAGNAAPGTQVDLNAIPAILVDRVERIAGSGAPVYGTDAIAATVNIILRRRLQGLETRATAGITTRADGFRRDLSAAGGLSFANGRGNLTMAAGHERVDGLTGSARAAYRANLGNATNPCAAVLAGVCSAGNLAIALSPAGRTPAGDGRINPDIGFNATATDGIPGTVLIRDLALPAVAQGGVLSSGAGAYAWRFAPDGSLVPYARGTLFGAAVPGPLAAAATASGGDGMRLGDYLALASTTRRTNLAAFLSYDANDRVELFAEALFYQGRSDELVQTPAFNAVLFGGASGALTFRTDNPLLTPQARAQLAALGYGATFQLSRAHDDLADLTGWSDNRLWRVAGGARGMLAIGGRDYRFDLSATWGRSTVVDHGETIDQQRFVNAINVARVEGQVVCSPTPTVAGLPAGQAPVADPGCVPLNLFGAGAPSPAALAYVRRQTEARSRLEQVVVNASIGGELLRLAGQSVAFNLGIEHHGEQARFTPDRFLQAGLGRSAAVAPVAGGYRLDEAFGEVAVPLGPLSLTGRARQVWASTGADFTAWAAGAVLAPARGIALRGSITRSFRTPSVAELHSPRTVQVVGIPDLCSPAGISAGPVPAVRRNNCAAFLTAYPGATPLIAATATVPAVTGGNPRLVNEQADSITVGLEARPRFAPGLTLAVDYIDIRIARPIASLSATQIAQGCFDNPDFNAADPARGNPFCALIRRDARGQVVSDAFNPGVTTGFVNGKSIRMSALQASLRWQAPLAAVGLPGAIDLAADVFHLRRRIVDVTGVAPARSDGVVGDPRWQAQTRIGWESGSSRKGTMWGASLRITYTGGQALALTGRGGSPNDLREIDHFRPFATFDAAVHCSIDARIQLALTATNMFDRIGQDYRGFIVPVSINDPVGRRLALGVTTHW